jgi:hypothetical protein
MGRFLLGLAGLRLRQIPLHLTAQIVMLSANQATLLLCSNTDGFSSPDGDNLSLFVAHWRQSCEAWAVVV